MDYSQNGEQKIIMDYFKDFEGTLLDIGANDGETLSNSRALMLNGWTGVLVEPSETAFKKLKDLYWNNTKARLCNAGISNVSGVQKFYESGTHLKKGDTSLLSTLDSKELKRWEGSDNEFKETNIKCITYSQLKEFYDYKFDFINIDAEGLDWEILKQINLSDTICLCIETNSIDDQKYIDYCANFGLKVLHKNFENIIFGL